MPEKVVRAGLHTRKSWPLWQAKRYQKMLRDHRAVRGARRRFDGQPCRGKSLPGEHRFKSGVTDAQLPLMAEGSARSDSGRRGASFRQTATERQPVRGA
jgi:hypothetical protein